MNNITKNVESIGFSIKKTPELSKKVSDGIESYLANLPKGMKLMLEKLGNDAKKISSVAYKLDNYILIPEKKYNHEEMMSEASKYMDNNPSILQFFKCKDIAGDINVYIYRIDDGTKDLIKYDKNKVTDKAKQDFYYNLKELIEDGRVEFAEIMDQEKWYMTKDGSSMYNISPHLNGHISCKYKESCSKQLFDKLFNDIK